MSIEPMSDGLLRQRRNLISVSCVLVFLKFSGVKIDNISFLSIDFGSLNNPAAIYIAIWIAYFYFLFRYYQHFIQEGLIKLKLRYYDCQQSRILRHVENLAKDINFNASFYPNQLIQLKNENWKVRVSYHGKQNQTTGALETVVANFTVSKIAIYKSMIYAACAVSFNSSAVTDYALPFLIAMFALIYCFHGAESSLLYAVRNGFS